jgi:hypothetical protein
MPRTSVGSCVASSSHTTSDACHRTSDIAHQT